MEALVSVAAGVLVIGQLAQVGLLTGVFYRLGRLGAAQEAHDQRIKDLEGRG